MGRELTKVQSCERSILKKYRRVLWAPFIAGVKRYELIKPGDRIAVCISGGKDSMLLAKLMQELHRHSNFDFSVEFMVMDPGYNAENRQKIVENAALLEIPVRIFDSDIFEVVTGVTKSPCYLCARMRRGFLYANARELGCNKIALGHHLNDVIETTLMGMLYGGQIQTMMPKLHSQNFDGMELIRPLYCVREDAVIAWAKHNGLEFLRCACRFTERAEFDADASKRLLVKNLIRDLMRDNEFIENNIFRSTHMVNLSTILGYKKAGTEYSFLDDYDC